MSTTSRERVWTVVGASVTGVSHQKTGMGCQDAHGSVQWRGGLLIAAVADGAGSAALAEVGSELAVRIAIRRAEEALLRSAEQDSKTTDLLVTLDEIMMRAILAAVREGLANEAGARGKELRDLATTLLLVAASDTRVVAIQVGDGAVVAQHESGEVFAVTKPMEAEYANATTFMTSPDALEAAQYVCLSQGVSALALFTDGLQRLALKLPEGTPHTPFFLPLFRFASELDVVPLQSASSADGFVAGTYGERMQHAEQKSNEGEEKLIAFLRSPRITERADDDLTLLLAIRK